MSNKSRILKKSSKSLRQKKFWKFANDFCVPRDRGPRSVDSSLEGVTAKVLVPWMAIARNFRRSDRIELLASGLPRVRRVNSHVHVQGGLRHVYICKWNWRPVYNTLIGGYGGLAMASHIGVSTFVARIGDREHSESTSGFSRCMTPSLVTSNPHRQAHSHTRIHIHHAHRHIDAPR